MKKNVVGFYFCFFVAVVVVVVFFMDLHIPLYYELQYFFLLRDENGLISL